MTPSRWTLFEMGHLMRLNEQEHMNLMSTILDDVQAALAEACSPDEVVALGPRHAGRSRRFVGALAARMRAAYQGNSDVAVLSKHYAGNRARFGLNELLFDILVCETFEVPAAVSARHLTVIRKAILAVESELEEDSREAIRDFNKLILCTADTKLFIGPRVFDQQAFLVPLARAAAHCSGRVLAVFVPHPSDWGSGKSMAPAIGYYWDATRWSELPSCSGGSSIGS